MQVQYLEIVTPDVDATCGARSCPHRFAGTHLRKDKCLKA